MSTSRVGTRVAWLGFALAAVACGPSQEMQTRLAELEGVAAQRDSMVQEIAGIAKLMSDINAEIADVQLEGVQLAQAESPIQASRDTVLAKIRVLNTRLGETQSRLDESRRRIRGLTRITDSLRTTLEETVTNYEQMLEAQRTTIATLTEQMQTLETENVMLAASIDTLSAEVDTLRTATSTVYYVVGTKDELLERGIIEKKGGSRILFIFGKAGETLVPARSLKTEDFTPIDKWDVTEILLPNPQKTYTIASLQDASYLLEPLDEKGRVQGSLKIGAPEGFWAPSKFLIVVEG